jgi:hypothetical protein
MEEQTKRLADGVRNHGMRPNGDQAGESGGTNGKAKPRRRKSKSPGVEKRPGRNLKIPDRLFDPISQYARTKKVPTTRELRVNGILVKTEPGQRYQTISEVICEAIEDFLKKKNIPFEAPGDDQAAA